MSVVSNVILTFGVSEEERTEDGQLDDGEAVIAKVNEHLRAEQSQAGEFVVPKRANCCYGTKYKVLETLVFVAAFNYLDVEKLVAHLRTIRWHYPSDVQLFVQGQHDDRFKEIDVFPNGPRP